MPTIRIGDELDALIQEKGRFGETHDDVIRRLLGLSAKKSSPTIKSTKAKTRMASKEGLVHKQEFFRKPLLIVLANAKGHQLQCKMGMAEVFKLIGHELKPMDFEKNSSGNIRWENNLQWVRNNLVKEGLIEPIEIAGHGLWRLTKKGILAAEGLL